MENSDQQFVTVENDKLALASYLRLQQLTHNNTFDYVIEIDGTVAEDFDRLPPLITQPFVENAVLHGVKDITNGQIKVRYSKEGGTLCVTIQDNGKGFVTKGAEEKRLHKSMSTDIIEKQFEILQKTVNGFKANITIDQSDGTKILLHIRYS